MLTPSVTGGLRNVVDYLVTTMADQGNLQVLLFLYLFSGFVFLIRRSGGIESFSEHMDKRVTTKRGVFLTLWALIPLTFIDCGFRVVAAGNIMRPLARRNGITRERLAFILNNTASPIVELVPIATTFVGFNIAIIQQGLSAAGIQDRSGYEVLLKAIPLQFFSIAVLTVTFLSILRRGQPHEGAMAPQHDHADSQAGEIMSGKEHAGDGMSAMMGEVKPEIKPRLFNLIIPMVSIVALSLYFFWYLGVQNTAGSTSISAVIANTQPNVAMLMALLVSLLLVVTLYLFQKYPLKKISDDMLAGGNYIMNTLVILGLAWSLAALSQDLGLSTFVKQVVGSSLPFWSLPIVLFVATGAVTYFIGSSWGAIALIMPFAIPLAVAADTSVPLAVAAVLSGGTFGDVSSPVSGMTNMSSNVAQADHLAYIKYAARFNFAAAGIAAILFVVWPLFLG